MREVDLRFNKFYDEINPAVRQEEIFRLLDDETLKADYDLAGRLFVMRHRIDKRKDLSVDTFLFNCMMLLSIEKSSMLFKGPRRRDVRKILNAMGADLVKNELEESIFYWELRNTVKRYFETCKDPNYKKKFFGLAHSSESERERHMLADAWKMSVGLATRLGMKEDMAIWMEAVRDEYSATGPDAADEFDGFLG